MSERTRFFKVLTALPAIVFFLAVYWGGLKNWFEQDDFAWLGLHSQVTDFSTFLNAMFAPMAQGTIRPWSERGFFLLFYRIFDTNAVPYHIAVFATHAANLLLLSAIMRKLTASNVAAVAAPILWTANSALLTPLCWVSDYNQIQCAFFLLLAFWLFLENRYWLQLAAFVLGFGALELNIVYPALLLAFLVLCRPERKPLVRLLPFFAIAMAYYVLHFAIAPRQSAGVYALHFDGALPATLWTYWTWVFAPVNAHQPLALVLILTLFIIGFVFQEAARGRRLPLFFLLWFLITLGPILPLKDHISDYYLTIPSLGIAAILAIAASSATKWLSLRAGQRAVPVLAVLAIGFYLTVHVPLARFGTQWYLGHTRPVRGLVRGVQQAQRLHPGKTILLTDVSDDLYLDSLAHSVFRALNIQNVYLAPELIEKTDRLDKDNPDARAMVLPAGATIHALKKENLVVYSAAGERLRNVTSLYEHTVGDRFGWNEEKNLPQRVDAGSPLLAYLLGSSWYPPVGNFRWMPSRASFRIGGPKTPDQKFTLAGFCPPAQTESGPLTLFVGIDGEMLPEVKIAKPETSFSRTFVLPPAVAGREFIEVTLAVDRTLKSAGDSSPLGLAFGVFEIR